jgi:hypothetical protein
MVIRLLRMLIGADLPSYAPTELKEHGRAEAIALARSVIDHWQANEDIDGLRDLLGLGRKRGRRRTTKQAAAELQMVQTYLRFVISGRSDPSTAAASTLYPDASQDQLESHRKRIENAVDKWTNTDMWWALQEAIHESRNES